MRSQQQTTFIKEKQNHLKMLRLHEALISRKGRFIFLLNSTVKLHFFKISELTKSLNEKVNVNKDFNSKFNCDRTGYLDKHFKVLYIK